MLFSPDLTPAPSVQLCDIKRGINTPLSQAVFMCAFSHIDESQWISANLQYWLVKVIKLLHPKMEWITHCVQSRCGVIKGLLASLSIVVSLGCGARPKPELVALTYDNVHIDHSKGSEFVIKPNAKLVCKTTGGRAFWEYSEDKITYTKTSYSSAIRENVTNSWSLESMAIGVKFVNDGYWLDKNPYICIRCVVYGLPPATDQQVSQPACFRPGTLMTGHILGSSFVVSFCATSGDLMIQFGSFFKHPLETLGMRERLRSHHHCVGSIVA